MPPVELQAAITSLNGGFIFLHFWLSAKERTAQALGQNYPEQGDTTPNQVVTVQLLAQENHGNHGGEDGGQIHENRGFVCTQSNNP